MRDFRNIQPASLSLPPKA